MELNKIIQGDVTEVLKSLPPQSVQCIVTSPPYYGLRDYGVDGQLGLEETPDEYVEAMVRVFKEAWRVLKDDGTLWLNLGDSYASRSAPGQQGKNGERADRRFTASDNLRRKMAPGIKSKDLIGIPWRVALALQADGWYLRNDIVWEKPNCLPEAVTDRLTRSHEYVFMLTKKPQYYFNQDAIREPWVQRPNDIKRASEKHPGYNGKNSEGQAGVKGQPVGDPSKGRNKRTVWRVSTHPYKGAHFAVFPQELIVPMIKAGCMPGGVVLDPFMGSGTTAIVADALGCNWLGIELNPEYIKIATERIGGAKLF